MVTKSDTITLQQSNTFQQLQLINDSVCQANAARTSRINWLRSLYLVSADAIGAYEMGKIGGTVGSLAGPTGTIVGGAVGGLIGGIGMSWGAYESSKGCAGLSGFLTLQDMINAYKGMCSVTPRPEEDYTLAMPDNLEDIGKLHNMTMDYLMVGENTVMPLGNELEKPVGPGVSETPVLSELELRVLESEEYGVAYNSSMEVLSDGVTIPTVMSDGSLKDEIMIMYMDAIGSYSSNDCYNEIVNLTNEYLQIVRASDELSDDDKDQLSIAFAVAVYSYQYWSTHDIEN